MEITVKRKLVVLVSAQLLILLWTCLTCSSMTTIPAPAAPPMKKYFVVVQGVVYCRSRKKLPSYNKNLHAAPLPGAEVKLQCNITTHDHHPYEQTAITDNMGYFYIQASRHLTRVNVKMCKVFLVSSPMIACKKPTNINGGITGSKLVYEYKDTSVGNSHVYFFYTPGLLMFNSTSCSK